MRTGQVILHAGQVMRTGHLICKTSNENRSSYMEDK